MQQKKRIKTLFQGNENNRAKQKDIFVLGKVSKNTLGSWGARYENSRGSLLQ